MRYIMGILFILFFVGFAACTFLLGGPPSQVFQISDILLGAALLCAVLSLAMLAVLGSGLGARGRKISLWRVPALCLIPLFASFGLALLLLTSKPLGSTAEHLALETKLKICAFAMIVFGIITLAGMIAAPILAKSHNAKLPA